MCYRVGIQLWHVAGHEIKRDSPLAIVSYFNGLVLWNHKFADCIKKE